MLEAQREEAGISQTEHLLKRPSNRKGTVSQCSFMIVKECHAIMVFRREELGCAININTINISEDVGE